MGGTCFYRIIECRARAWLTWLDEDVLPRELSLVRFRVEFAWQVEAEETIHRHEKTLNRSLSLQRPSVHAENGG
jgi:hypothetical protein